MSPSANAAWPVKAAGAAPCSPGPAAKGPQVLRGPLGGQSEGGGTTVGVVVGNGAPGPPPSFRLPRAYSRVTR